ncbi:elongation factor G [Microlunatus parietis]|uniref:Ribosomal protection tetracycline resistance protein n=1 Tax=Microlunatus parietis TaxID=682979 RepID=A0A7Y9I4K6_9ACTN|nr:TetM/TetW/TetO/TetS family tetracycline resistance ribosomal protection protein [Microlunatus parietis]NYE70077.1 ribosomal protection tetracycline resistance protein [Microlunatus parietis]
MDCHPSQLLNLGVVAHVDAGKTTLTERLLYAAGASDRVGRVDHGDTVTDNDELERERGITIRTAVAALTLGDLQVNLIDTPGHTDFVAEVERAMAVLDGVILVVSAVEGVQAHTRMLIKVLLRLGLPFLIFINKIDRVGARDHDLITELNRLLPVPTLPLAAATALGTPAASARSLLDDAPAQVAEQLAGFDDQLLGEFVANRWPPTTQLLIDRLRSMVLQCAVHPVFLGSALAGSGVAPLIAALPLLAPDRHSTGSAHGEVFKVVTTPRGRLGYVRIDSGQLGRRTRIDRFRRTAEGTIEQDRQLITDVSRFHRGGETSNEPAGPGDIAVISGIRDLRIGDQLGAWQPNAAASGFRRPGLEAVVTARNAADGIALREALRILTDEDPLINARFDDHDQRLTVSLYGEVQRQVIAERLRREYGIAVAFSTPTPAYLEQVIGTGTADHPFAAFGFAARVGLRVEPAPADAPLRCDREVEHGALPRAFFTAITETVSTALRQGVYGWPVIGCRVVITATDYDSVGSTGGDFRNLVPVILAEALSKAGTRVCEPYSSIEVDVPLDAAGPVLALLGRLRAAQQQPRFGSEPSPASGPDAVGTIEAVLPTGNTAELETRLDALTAGRGVVAAQPAGHRPMGRPWPRRARTDDNPYQPAEYLRHLSLR